MPKTLIAIVGPTAIGKTKRAIALANHFNTEIISADSRQFYQEMSIGTAVPTSGELRQAKHHFIQHISVSESYSVGDFEREALETLEKLFETHEIVIMAGGSGLYIDAILKGLDHFPTIDPKIRLELNTIFKNKGITALQDQLKELDKNYYQKVDLENPHRLIRALEVCIATRKPFSSFLKGKGKKRSFNYELVGIRAEREVVYNRINTRVDQMIENGLIEEARKLLPQKELNALQTVGYKELFLHFDGKLTLENAVEEIKKNSRRFAKRQLTWYRKNQNVLWLDHDLTNFDFIGKVEQHIKQLQNG